MPTASFRTWLHPDSVQNRRDSRSCRRGGGRCGRGPGTRCLERDGSADQVLRTSSPDPCLDRPVGPSSARRSTAASHPSRTSWENPARCSGPTKWKTDQQYPAARPETNSLPGDCGSDSESVRGCPRASHPPQAMRVTKDHQAQGRDLRLHRGRPSESGQPETAFRIAGSLFHGLAPHMHPRRPPRKPQWLKALHPSVESSALRWHERRQPEEAAFLIYSLRQLGQILEGRIREAARSYLTQVRTPVLSTLESRQLDQCSTAFEDSSREFGRRLLKAGK